ncbi:UDP-N-acetylenolpyruvoylglucosamine reductase [Desulfonema ishimotonii]|uniref:UDP-N-acetylenolpyruvoylglucosamine reductase n=1 Tax=Desulfonema ishimotonii TaxID=45657 RepID=A0A401FYE6_9BACT|nr:UDP-N-acetylmuramate dehydrogenase [Desulfonema ishimotonii]GBC61987.1 UDP-N-acetylenolpyruvoylglucosamine reductase [Desulfonema ishimotonii]
MGIFDSEARAWLKAVLGDNVRFDEPMSKHTSLKVGGAADAYVRPDTPETLTAVVGWAHQNGIPLTVIGDGTNLLVRDGGIRGIVIVLTRCLRDLRMSGDAGKTVRVTAGAGVRLAALCRFAVANGLEGMKFGLGIPGTVGGGMMMNAGTAWGEMGDVLDSLTLLAPDGHIRILPADALVTGYRTLSWEGRRPDCDGSPPIILSGCFRLRKSDKSPAELTGEAREILSIRHERQPVSSPSAGCFFRNPPAGSGAGALIDRAGMKGATEGGAQVSTHHANFIINRDHARGADILALAARVRDAVFRRFGVVLEKEVRVIGATARG